MTPTRLPGFFGEASLYMSGNSYVSAMRHGAERIYPASYIDQGCLSGCLTDCGSECEGSGSGKASCIRQCAQDNALCRSWCTRQGGSGGGGGTTCPPGLTDCGGTCTDTTTDPLNCGGCTNSCPPGACCGTATLGMFGPTIGPFCGKPVTCPTVGASCCPTLAPICRRSPFGLGDFCSPV